MVEYMRLPCRLYTSTFALLGRFSSVMAFPIACMRILPLAIRDRRMGVGSPEEEEDGLVSVLELLGIALELLGSLELLLSVALELLGSLELLLSAGASVAGIMARFVPLTANAHSALLSAKFGRKELPFFTAIISSAYESKSRV